MARPARPALLALASLLLALAAPAAADCSAPPPVTAAFCRRPPVASTLSLPAYQGKWYQIYTSGTASAFSSNRCVTANYTLAASGKVRVLNCQAPPGAARPTCVAGVAARRPGLTPANLRVRFGRDAPPGPYNVVALLGDKVYGYFAAAVYSCEATKRGFDEGFFIIARSPFLPLNTLDLLRERLTCMGFPLDDRFELSTFDSACTFFDGPAGFDLRPPARPSPEADAE